MLKEKITETEKKKIKVCVAILMISVIIAFGIQLLPNKKLPDEEIKPDFSGVTEICELATLRCYYHNVAKLNESSKGIFKYGWGKYGYKKLWMEYDAIIEIGIDANEVEVHEPKENGIVEIYIPKATIINVDSDENSMETPICEKGKFTRITTEDQRKAYENAQTKMRKSADNDKSIKKQAYENAQKLLEQYVVKIGEQSGKQYTVEWLDEPKGTN